MHILELGIRDFRCFTDTKITFDKEVNVFVGNNGSGKSAILDAIAAALYPYVDKLAHIGRHRREQAPVFATDLRIAGEGTPRELSFEIKTSGGPDWALKYDTAKDGDDHLDPDFQSGQLDGLWSFLEKIEDRQIPVVAYYSGARNVTRIGEAKSTSNQSPNRFDSFVNALTAAANYSNLVEWFFFREVEELRGVRTSKNLEFVLQDLVEVRRAITEIVMPSAKVFFGEEKELVVQCDCEDGTTREFSLVQLSSGFRNMLALVMDYARRLAQANPQLENPLQGPGILLIDEIDLHLHPTWQQRIIPDLRRVFPGTQLIVSTHSPEVVTTVLQKQVQLLDHYNVLPCPSPTYGMKTSDVVRHVIGLKELRPDNVVSRMINSLFSALDRSDLTQAREIREKLRIWDSENYDSDLTRIDMRIRRLENIEART
jgi:predicted ATP-binding protein involved in virulence